MDVVNCTLYRDNYYQQLLYSAISDRYSGVKGTVDDAIERQRSLGPADRQILHVHWEEHIVRPATSQAEARFSADYFIERLEVFKNAGGRIVWTVHNLSSHENEYNASFLKIRRALMQRCDRALVHSTAAVTELHKQGTIAHSKLFLLPHPSYGDKYGPVADRSDARAEKRLLLFGKIRRYKAVDNLIDRFLASSLPGQGYTLHIAGEPLKNESYGEELKQAYGDQPHVHLDFRRIEDDELSSLFGKTTCMFIAYERFLTSGAMMAAMTHGVPVIAPDISYMREVLPPAQHPLLYNQQRPQTMMGKAEVLGAMEAEPYAELCRELVERSDYFSPHFISNLLGQLYDSLREI